MRKDQLDLIRKARENMSSGEREDLNSHVLLIDGLNMFIRVFTVVPALNANGDHVGGVLGFLKSMAYCIRQFSPTRVIIVFDGKGGSKRRKGIFSDYKSNRINQTNFNRFDEFKDLVDEQESMRIQISRLAQYLKTLPVSVISLDHVEADDIIAYIATDLAPKKCTIVSTDKDFYQLVNERINVWSPSKKVLYDPAKIKEEFGIIPENILTYRLFDGDSSDNIPGIDGIGLGKLKKYFPRIISENISFGDIIKEARDRIEAGSKLKTFESIAANEAILDRNYKLMQLNDVSISSTIKSTTRKLYDTPPPKMNPFFFKRMFLSDQLNKTLKNFDDWFRNSFSKLNKFARNE